MRKLEHAPSQMKPRKKGFERIKPLLSALKRPGKIIGKAAGIVVFSSAMAICGANLGTYFDYAYNTHDYRSMGNRTRVELQDESQREDPLLNLALETARVPIIGAQAPEETQLFIDIERNEDRITLTTRYVMVWSTNKGVAQRDEEEMTIHWNYDEDTNRFIPDRAVTRYHYREVEFNLSPRDNPVIVIQNPAHTPGIPGPSPRYTDGEPETVDLFTVFSAEKWAGCALSTGLPQTFSALDVIFRAELDN